MGHISPNNKPIFPCKIHSYVKYKMIVNRYLSGRKCFITVQYIILNPKNLHVLLCCVYPKSSVSLAVDLKCSYHSLFPVNFIFIGFIEVVLPKWFDDLILLQQTPHNPLCKCVIVNQFIRSSIIWLFNVVIIFKVF